MSGTRSIRNLKLTVAQYRLLDQCARGTGHIVQPKEKATLNVLLREHLVYEHEKNRYTTSGTGQRYLNKHILRSDGSIIVCGKSRPQVLAATIKTDYGFTDKLIKELLPAPILAQNPWYRTAAPMKLWYDDEVAAISRQPDVAPKLEAVLARRGQRQASARKAVETRKAETARVVDKAISSIRVERLPLKQVRRSALWAKAEWYEATEQWDKDVDLADEDTKRRWMVNYIRHNLTDYDDSLYQMSGRPGCHEEYKRYKFAVLEEIAETYPALQSECVRQKTDPSLISEPYGSGYSEEEQHQQKFGRTYPQRLNEEAAAI